MLLFLIKMEEIGKSNQINLCLYFSLFTKHFRYGTLKEENVPELIEEHLIKDKILWNHWRGKTGLSKEDAEALHAKHTIVS